MLGSHFYLMFKFVTADDWKAQWALAIPVAQSTYMMSLCSWRSLVQVVDGAAEVKYITDKHCCQGISTTVVNSMIRSMSTLRALVMGTGIYQLLQLYMLCESEEK